LREEKRKEEKKKEKLVKEQKIKGEETLRVKIGLEKIDT